MITNIVARDITSSDNHADIIIGMNTTLEEVTGIGLPFVGNIPTIHLIDLGSVLSFRFDEKRAAHMLICHNIGCGGWTNADQHIRFGLEFLWRKSHIDGDSNATYSIVQIGTGPIGIRDGADPGAIRTAIATSFLPLTLFIRDSMVGASASANREPMHTFRAWSPIYGEEQLTTTIQ